MNLFSSTVLWLGSDAAWRTDGDMDAEIQCCYGLVSHCAILQSRILGCHSSAYLYSGEPFGMFWYLPVTRSQAEMTHCRRQWPLMNDIYWKLNRIFRCSVLFYLSVTLTYVGIIPLKGMRNHFLLVLPLKLGQAVFILHTWAIYRRSNIVLCVLCIIVSVSLIADMVWVVLLKLEYLMEVYINPKNLRAFSGSKPLHLTRHLRL